ncbi:T9SS type A sorting domain-containing protein [Chryseobacterium turcicum]|uniref:T9SS type A sorting domain-containing protein n=1 Tax=Chryseobacterium turcicum TaxID=2898076 RepID=A0A9Q3V4X4_9FLAO|nr:T9SS type A sorting domain-containing protein [Chryseobacterium turcicum]MCD1117321.1 T9SS type A sorting domain-containing protein [Chryseobacterium turcicum]
MKTKLFFLFISCSLFGQNAELFNNNWYISQITIANQTVNSPIMELPIASSLFQNNGSSGYSFVSSYYNSAGSSITFNTVTDSFTRHGTAVTLLVYNGTNAAAAQSYDQKNWEFYFNAPVGNIYNYQIMNSGSSKTLTITNATTGDKIVYNNSFLGTKESALKKKARIFPNPTSDFLIVEDVEKNLNVKIFDLSGKVLYETLSSGKELKINTTDFQKGQYILSIENFKPEFFIKK